MIMHTTMLIRGIGMNEKALCLGNEKISKLLWQFSLPSVASTLASSIYMIIDRIFVGQVVGAEAIAGMSITMPISFIILAFGMLIATGAGTLVSMRLGEANYAEAELITGNALTLMLVISFITCFLLLIFLDQILIIFGAGPAVLSYAREFIRIIIWGSVFQYLLFCLPTIIRAEGNPVIAMNILLINVATNIFLDFIFIYLMSWGVKGAALATVLSQAIACGLVWRHFHSPNSLLRLRFKNMRLNRGLARGIIALGTAPFAMQMAGSVINVLYNQNLARYGGDAAIGAYGIIYAVVMFLVLPVLGISMGVQPIMAFNYGAKLYDRVIEALRKAVVAATLITTTGFILLELLPRQILGVFTHDRLLIDTGAHGMRVIIVMLPIVGFQVLSSSFLQSIGKARPALLLTLLRQVIMQIPILLLLPRCLGLTGVWLASPIADAIAAVITLMVLLPEIRALKSGGGSYGRQD